MKDIIIGFSREEDRKRIQKALEKYGFQDVILCASGAQILREAGLLEKGIVISGVRLKDMHCTELREYLPEEMEMMVIGSQSNLSECPDGIITIASPIRIGDLINTVAMMQDEKAGRIRKKAPGHRRDMEEERTIRKAKELLMERNRLSGMEAHRYLQKRSMEMGRTMAESAQMILMLYDNA